MSKSSEGVKKWRKTTKARIVESMGGECQICGYKKLNQALELHHLNPEEKELSFGKITASPISWERIVIELRKCVLLCSNCHKEVHAEVSIIPESYNSFNEDYVDYKKIGDFNKCPVCGKDKPVKNVTCSLSCAANYKRRVDWDNIDLMSLLEKYNFNYSEVGEKLGVTHNSVRKRYKKVYNM